MLIILLDEIARRKNTSFWYSQLGDLCLVDLAYVNGARFSALFYFIKALELNSKNTLLLNAILECGEPPEVVLTIERRKYYANKLLALEPENERALAIINL
ncbi:hypothetical protein [Psychrobacter immobilis]|uniref:hypothetical protein n=1 Tax=Psychrobacter immobilis TaxID=498 RepID=UPI001917EE24|nr:hypothetical protein [Psychrobacter immobilis]